MLKNWEEPGNKATCIICAIDAARVYDNSLRAEYSLSQGLSGSAQGRANSSEALPNPTQQAPSNYTLTRESIRTPTHRAHFKMEVLTQPQLGYNTARLSH